MDGLRAQLASLGSADTVREAEEAHRLAVEAAGAASQAPPSLLAFVLEMLGKRGLEQLEIVRFDITKEASSSTAPAAPALVRPTARALPPERPRAEGGLGDNPRMAQRAPVKELPLSEMKRVAEAAAVAQRAEARGQFRTAPPKDPLWVAVNSTAIGM